MIKRIAALAFIYLCTAIAWIILGVTLFARTNSPASHQLSQSVASVWGSEQTQAAPSAAYQREVARTVAVDGKSKIEKTTETAPLPLESSRINVAFDLAPREKGLLWYSTYRVAFAADYVFSNPTAQDRMVSFSLPLPSQQTIYDDLVLTLDNRPLAARVDGNSVSGAAPIPAGKSALLHAAYTSQGLNSWRYSFGAGVSQVHNFELRMHTNFKAMDFPEDTLSPAAETRTASGWDLTWNYKDLLSGYQIGMTMPDKLQPGPLAGKISFFAPVSLFFFFFLLFIITAIRGIDLHPMNYFFLAGAFFAFHLLLAYLVDHISIHLAFLICSAVSIFLVVSYLRLVAGIRFAAVEAGIAQFIYLVLFSYTFFLKGFTGLAITIGSIVTLFVVMQATGRIRWDEQFARLKR